MHIHISKNSVAPQLFYSEFLWDVIVVPYGPSAESPKSFLMRQYRVFNVNLIDIFVIDKHIKFGVTRYFRFLDIEKEIWMKSYPIGGEGRLQGNGLKLGSIARLLTRRSRNRPQNHRVRSLWQFCW